MADTVNWCGYEFKSYPYNAEWHPVAGVYIFVGINAKNQWIPLYVGVQSQHGSPYHRSAEVLPVAGDAVVNQPGAASPNILSRNYLTSQEQSSGEAFFK